jgi:calcineurin-like phosphoesterase family protein
MDAALLNYWCNLVRPSDTVYFLGDFIFSVNKEIITNVVGSMRAKEVHFIAGNHDTHLKGATKSLFTSYSDYKEITVHDVNAPGGVQHIVLCHYPMLSWNRSFYGSWMLHGHCHGNLGEDKTSLRMDVGVDPCGFKPISYEQIRDKMKGKQPKMLELAERDL